MRTLSVSAVVRADHTLIVQVPEDIPPGTYQVDVVLDATSTPSGPATSEWRLPIHDVGSWPEGFTLRREDIYGDDGR